MYIIGIISNAEDSIEDIDSTIDIISRLSKKIRVLEERLDMSHDDSIFLSLFLINYFKSKI